VYFAPTAEQPRMGVHRRCPHCFVPEEEWLSRRSHHTAQRTVPFSVRQCGDTGTPCTPSLPTPRPRNLGPLPLLSPSYRRGHGELRPRTVHSVVYTSWVRDLSLHLSSEVTTAPSGILLSSPSLLLVSTPTFVLDFRTH
jgi:hypothetical protein